MWWLSTQLKIILLKHKRMPMQPTIAFKSGKVWNDVDGKPIQAHGGGIIKIDDTLYYWYGENKDAETTLNSSWG